MQGIQTGTTWGSPISTQQLKAMEKRGSVLYMVQLHTAQTVPSQPKPIPPAIQEIINDFQPIFQSLPHLPPSRKGDHTIPLLPGAQPFHLRPYRYNPFQKDEIEK